MKQACEDAVVAGFICLYIVTVFVVVVSFFVGVVVGVVFVVVVVVFNVSVTGVVDDVVVVFVIISRVLSSFFVDVVTTVSFSSFERWMIFLG